MVDRSLDPSSQGTVHENSFTVHRHGSQWEKDFGYDPIADIHSDPDPTVSIYYRFIRGVFVLSNRRKCIHQEIQWSRLIADFEYDSFAWSDGPKAIYHAIGLLRMLPTVLRKFFARSDDLKLHQNPDQTAKNESNWEKD